MKIREQFPNLQSASDEELLNAISPAILAMFMRQIVEYYNSKLSLKSVLKTRGIYISEEQEQAQIQCPLPKHGEDFHPSARYYMKDRDTDTLHEQIYCFKCSEAHTAFSLLWTLQKAQGRKFREALIYIRNQFGVPVPRDFLLNLDPDSLLDMNQSSSQVSRISPEYFSTILSYTRSLKQSQTPATYLTALENFYPSLFSFKQESS